MKRIPVVLATLLLFSICSGCDDQRENARSGQDPPRDEPPAPASPGQTQPAAEASAAGPSGPRVPLDADLARLMTGFGATVKGVRDAATWAEAKPKLEAILEEISLVSERLKTLPAPTPEEFRHFHPRTQAREAALEQTLGDKNAFLGRLPPTVGAELGSLAGQFFSRMGEAQILLRGTPPPVKTTLPKPSR